MDGIKELLIKLDESCHMVGGAVKGMVVMEKIGHVHVKDVIVSMKGWIQMKDEGVRDEKELINETIPILHKEPVLNSILEEEELSVCAPNSNQTTKYKNNYLINKLTKFTKEKWNKIIIKSQLNKIKDNKDDKYNANNQKTCDMNEENISTYPFIFYLPANLPSSLETKFLSVRYIIEIMVITSKQYFKFFETFEVTRQNLYCSKENFQNPIIKSKQSPSSLIHCCIGGGRVALRVELNGDVFGSGDRMKVVCRVNNYTEDSVMLYCQLHQIISFQCYEITRKSSTPIWQPPITLLKPQKRDHRTFTLTLAAIPPSFDCPFVNLHYLLKIGLLAKGSTRNITLNFPIIIAKIMS